MGKKHLLPQGNEEFLERLGLTDIDKKVYVATLDGGLVSLGEIQQLTDLKDLGRILESVRDLIDVGLIKKAKGTMRRYYATLPFFRETLSVEKEFRFALEAMIDSLNQSKEQTTQNRERIVAIKFPEIVDELLDRYYKEILSPILQDLENLRDEVKSNVMPFIKEIDQENTQFKEELNLMLKPLKNYAELLDQKFDLGISNEEGQLKQYVVSRKQKRLELLQEAHKSIGTHLKTMTSEISNLVGELRSMHSSLTAEVNKFHGTSQDMSQQAQTLHQSAEVIKNAKKEIQAELVVAREQLKKAVGTADGDLSAQIDEIFAKMNGKLQTVDLIGADPGADSERTTPGSTRSFQSLETVLSSLDQTINAVQSRLTTTFEHLKKEMGAVFNSLNDSDEESLQELKGQIEIGMMQLADAIKEEGESVREKLDSHMSTILSQQEATMNRYQEKMASLYSQPAEKITPFLDQWLDEIEPIINQFKAKSDEALVDILEPIQELETGTFSTLTERIGFVKAMIEGRSNDIQQVLDAAKEFDFTKTADTSVVVGLPAIYATLTDLLLRSKNNVTVITPHMDLELLEVARTLKSIVRVTFVSDIDPEKDARLVKKIEEMGRINLRYYPERDLYACIRDNEEMVMGYIKDGEETLGIRSSTPSMVDLFIDRLNEIVLRHSKAL